MITLVHSHSSEEVHSAFLIVGLVLLIVINLIFLVDIELTLSRNKHFQVAGDNTWGFGQVLALLLLVVPLRDAGNALRNVQAGLRGVQQQFHQLLRDELVAKPVVDRLQILITQDADPRKPIRGTGFGNSLQLAAYLGAKDIVEFLFSSKNLADKHVNETSPSKFLNFYYIYHPINLFQVGVLERHFTQPPQMGT